MVPYSNNANGVSTDMTAPAGCEVTATLDNRTYTNNDDPQHTTTDFGTWDDNDVSARLDLGALQIDSTDLSIASWGPPAEVSRTYLASNTGTRFAPGWVFNFDQHLDLSQLGSDIVNYYDACGDKHQFLYSTSWNSPSGFLGTLAPSGSNWTITYPDGTVDTFSSTGALQSEADRNSNTTTYSWNAGNLTITAANGQSIAVTCNASGQATVPQKVQIRRGKPGHH